MLSGVTILCFAASYAVALGLEVSRLLFRSGIRGAVMLGFAGAGMLAHTAFLYYRAVPTASPPLSSSRDWYLLAAWVLAGVYLYMVWRHPKTHLGLFLLPLVLGLIATATWFADEKPFAREPASKAWGIIHATSILLATVAVLVGFAAGLMYLHQAWHLKHKRLSARRVRLPSLEWLQRANARAIVVSLVMLAIGVASGIILNVINYRHHEATLPWSDPVVLSTLVMMVWLVGATLVVVFYQPAREGRKVAYLTLASFVFLTIALAIGLATKTQHGELRDQGTGDRGQGAVGSEQESAAGATGSASAAVELRQIARWTDGHRRAALVGEFHRFAEIRGGTRCARPTLHRDLIGVIDLGGSS